MGWLQLVRWKNLLIVFFTQLTVWACVIAPLSPQFLNIFNFLLLAISTVFIAAAGYIINDYFDIKIDLVNKPDKMVLGRLVSARAAIVPHAVLNVVGVGLATWLALQLHQLQLVALQLLCVALLWFYSTHFKRQFVVGNIVVALLTALTVLTPGLYEPALAARWKLPFLSPDMRNGISALPVWILLGYGYFAFMLTLMREVVKDMEDVKGDAGEGCDTMPIRMGLQTSARIVKGIAVLAIAPLLVGSYVVYNFHYRLLAFYMLVFLILPIALWAFILPAEADAEQYHKASSRLKLIMLAGVCSLIVYHIQLLLGNA